MPSAESELAEPTLTRRQAMQGAAGIATLAIVGPSLAGSAAAQVNFGAFASHDPERRDTVEIAEIGPEMEPLEYVDDTGQVADLTEYGFLIADRDDDTDDDEPWNRVQLNARNIVAGFNGDFPRGEFTEDEEGEDDEPISAIEAEHWDGDTGILGEDGDALTLNGAGTVTFDAFDAITSGVPRKYLYLVVDVNDLPANEGATITVKNDAGTEEAVFEIEGGATPGDEDHHILATETGTGQVFQRRVGDVNDDLDEIAEIEIEVTHADVSLTVHGFDLERESRISFGQEEYIDDDDDLDTQTVYEPSGDYWITTYRSLDDLIQNETVEDVRFKVVQSASMLPDEAILARESETEVYDRPVLVEKAFLFEVPTAFDLSWPEIGSLEDEVQVSSSRYAEVGVQVDTEAEDWDDIDDILEDELLTTRSTHYDSVGNDVELTTAAAPGETVLVYYKLNLAEDEADSLLSSPAILPTADEDEGFGFMSILLGGVAGLVGAFALLRRRATKAAGSMTG